MIEYPEACTYNYLVFVDYGTFEGWKIHSGHDMFHQAIKAREEAMSLGNRNVLIVKPSRWEIQETA